MHLGASAVIFRTAQLLRLRETPAEKLLWSRLRNNQLGVKFRRQHPMLNYVVDFYCHSAKLAVELDGPIHETAEQKFHDMERTDALGRFRLTVIRFRNDEVINDVDQVVDKIHEQLAK